MVNTATLERTVLGSSLVKGVGRDLHDNVRDPVVDHFPAQSDQVKGFRCGHRGRDRFACVAVVHRAEHAGLSACGVDNGFQKIGRRGLAAGSRDADEGDGLEGVGIESQGEFGKSLSRVWNKDGCYLSLSAGERLSRKGHSAFLDRLVDKPVAVRTVAANGHKEITGLDLTRVISQAFNLQGRITPEFEVRQSF